MLKFVLIVGISVGLFLSVAYAGSNEATSDGSDDDSADDDNINENGNDTECSCKKNCPEGEEYSDCPQAICGPLTCDETGFPKTICGDKATCKPGCICKGKLRNKDGQCVSPDQCPSCGGDNNATSGCGTNCKKLCTDLVNPNRVCGIGCTLNGCDCKNGFYYDSNLRKCVKPEDCTSTCPKGEKYSACPAAICGPLTCAEAGYPKTCCSNSSSCSSNASCICQDSCLRDLTGKCIPSNQCPSCGGDENAIPSNRGNCGRTCADIGKNVTACPKVYIINGCECKPNYYYDTKTKKCVTADKCIPTCPAGEEYCDCPEASCEPVTCDEVGYPKPNCGNISLCSCKPRCVCKDGKVKDKAGKCVPRKECPSCGGDINAEPGCATNCGKKCSDVVTPNLICPRICKLNGCDCKKGYYYDGVSNKCVKPDDCPSSSVCPKPNEVYDKCPDCSPQTCATKDDVFHCPMIPANKTGPNCKPACRCKPGYLKNPEGVCVKECDCPIPTCPKGEVYSPCPPVQCDAENCPKNRDGPQSCPIPKKCGKGRCVCGINERRDRKTGKCIPIANCPPFKCDKENEVYASCPSPGPGKLCTDYLKNSTCPSDNSGNNTIVCRPACICKKDTYRNKKGNCVSGKQCKDDTCPDGEEYSECPDASCSPLTCDKAGFPNPNCGNSSSCPGKPGCICKDGKLKNKDGKCVDSNECPSCGGDENAVLGCGNHCGRTCADLRSNVTRICPLYCILNACSCRPNYYYDGNTKKCVKPEKCTPTCKGNEVYSSCANVICRPQDCKDKGKRVPCPLVKPGACVPGCICPAKHLKKNGVCVPEDQCDKPICKANEVYSSCPAASCVPKYCKDKGKPVPCPRLKPEACVPGCVCREKYLWKNGVCVPEDQCEDKPICKANEVYSSCPAASCVPKYCKDKGKPIPCPRLRPEACVPGCVCREKYLWKNGVCVPEDQCEDTPTCPIGEVYEKCAPVKCDADYCPKCRDSPQTCPIPKKCEKGRCVCGFNKKRDRKTGKCIPIANCPPFPCTKPNEVYDNCPPIVQCPGQTCADYLKNTTCPTYRIGIVLPCKPACRCKKGYYKDSKGNCVTPQKCKELACKPNEVFSSCSNGICRAQDCKDKGKPVPCPDLMPGACVPGCVCRENYLKKNGDCVPEDQCGECSCSKP
ncbi:unnamed protein product [Chilo suppressalis]|uniref:TIL domain-containing protein n=1 Tax=Chilo suppressalis TaxID=168631 RepID=A0ABN8LHW8_CHISP|nr:unnamed protein product [Chilo suppressalis]